MEDVGVAVAAVAATEQVVELTGEKVEEWGDSVRYLSSSHPAAVLGCLHKD